MKPGDHPEFFRLPAPPGRSRESTIVLDRQGRFFHDGAPVEHRGLARAFASWVTLHPDDGRFILSNEFDWCYFTVEATPYFVERLSIRDDGVVLGLFDGSEELLDPSTLHVEADGVLAARVKGGRFVARFTQPAQLAIEPILTDDGHAVVVGGERHAIGGVTSP